MKQVLFVCIGNAARSQMAEALFNQLAKGRARASSAGIKLAREVNPIAVQVMKEIGINISCQKPKPLTFDMSGKFDYIVTMGCIDACPITPKEKTIEWDIEDPKGKEIEKFREVRDTIKAKVEKLIEEIKSNKEEK